MKKVWNIKMVIHLLYGVIEKLGKYFNLQHQANKVSKIKKEIVSHWYVICSRMFLRKFMRNLRKLLRYDSTDFNRLWPTRDMCLTWGFNCDTSFHVATFGASTWSRVLMIDKRSLLGIVKQRSIIHTNHFFFQVVQRVKRAMIDYNAGENHIRHIKKL